MGIYLAAALFAYDRLLETDEGRRAVEDQTINLSRSSH